MIGKIIIGKSFNGCIKYCLNEKLSKEEVRQKNSRAEVLYYNQVFGSQRELINQFNDVRRLNEKVSKPVFHITLSLAPGEWLSKSKLEEVVRDCSTSLEFCNNQFIAIMHNDTNHQHLHIVANRIGFDGKTVSDSNNYKRMADFCRRMEEKHQLKKVLNPSRYLPREQRQLQREDIRKQRLKDDIRACLKTSNTYVQFEQKMRSLKYEVIKGRGIAFRDDKKVYTKGSEVGFSLATIEKALTLKNSFDSKLRDNGSAFLKNRNDHQLGRPRDQEKGTEIEIKRHFFEARNRPPEHFDEAVNKDLTKEAKKKRRKRQSL